MTDIWRGAAERLALWKLPAGVGRFLIAMIAVDLLLLALFLRWAYVEHYHVPSRLLGHLQFSLMDGSLAERFGYLKQALIVGLLLWLWNRQRALVYLGFALLFLTTLLDDSLELHEHLSHWALGGLGLPAFMQAKGELAAFALLGIVPACIVLLGYARADGTRRRDGEAMAIGFGVLFFFAVVADYLHEKVVEMTGRYDTMLSLFEDGGELIAMTFILALTLRLVQLAAARAPAVRAPAAVRGAGHAGFRNAGSHTTGAA